MNTLHLSDEEVNIVVEALVAFKNEGPWHDSWQSPEVCDLTEKIITEVEHDKQRQGELRPDHDGDDGDLQP